VKGRNANPGTQPDLGRDARLLKMLSRVDLLILDDWGLAPLTGDQRRDLLEVVAFALSMREGATRVGPSPGRMTPGLGSSPRRQMPRPAPALTADDASRSIRPASSVSLVGGPLHGAASCIQAGAEAARFRP